MAVQEVEHRGGPIAGDEFNHKVGNMITFVSIVHTGGGLVGQKNRMVLGGYRLIFFALGTNVEGGVN